MKDWPEGLTRPTVAQVRALVKLLPMDRWGTTPIGNSKPQRAGIRAALLKALKLLPKEVPDAQ